MYMVPTDRSSARHIIDMAAAQGGHSKISEAAHKTVTEWIAATSPHIYPPFKGL
jgi:hypothetical protein